MHIIKEDPNSLEIKSWCNNIEEGALLQAKNLAILPFAFKHICLMPDTHQGYGMPIGGVMATIDMVVPNAVGVDIGCGMCALKTSFTSISIENLKKILSEIRINIPVGFSKHSKKQELFMPIFKDDLPVVKEHYSNAQKSLGTLGGGNHFIEIQKGSDGYIWVMIHSGSRNLGKQVADFYNKKAKEYCINNEEVIKNELAYLPINSEFGSSYLKEMNFCVDFAYGNRKHMMEVIKNIISFNVGDFDILQEINIPHNYASFENHFGKNVYVHRKGATSAWNKQLGIIPGSQGTSSYIVSGKGNPESFSSCSHGAGRKMGRKQAERTLSLDEEKNRLDSKGILHSVRGVKDLDEAPGAYKDIDEVMSQQTDLINIEVKLEPLAVVKG